MPRYGMIKFTATFKVDGESGKWSFSPVPDKGCSLPNDAELVALIRMLADRVESDARAKLN